MRIPILLAMVRVAALAILFWATTANPCRAAEPGVQDGGEDQERTPLETDSQRAEFFRQQLRPFVEQHCFDCHAAEEPEGDLALDTVANVGDLGRASETWEKVLRMLRSQQMPPEDAPQPLAADVERIANGIETLLAAAPRGGRRDPGSVTIRRLNRTEYRNTIRDLLHLELPIELALPDDDVGYGFDNIGDVLSLPPLLLEKYLAAAEWIAQRAIVVDPQQAVPRRTLDLAKLHGSHDFRFTNDGARRLDPGGELWASHDFARTDEYLIRIRAYERRPGSTRDEPPQSRLAIWFDGRQGHAVDVRATADHPGDYEFRMRAASGEHEVRIAFIKPEGAEEAVEADEQREHFLSVLRMEIVGPLDVGSNDYPRAHREIFSVAADEGLSRSAAAKKIVRRLASRVYRREPTDEQVDRLLHLVEQSDREGGNFEQGIRMALRAMLVSPYFLFMVELDREPQSGEAVRVLDEHELATRMSYFLWCSMPDEQLLHHARRGTLRANLGSEIQRMLRDPKASALSKNFAVQWLQLRNLEDARPDRDIFPEYDEDLRNAMLQETVLFFDAIRREDRSVLDLLAADFTFVNEPLARHYGLEGVTGAEFRRVSLGEVARGGVLTQASVLTVTSNPTRTSPVKRGLWIMENLLGTPPPPPPPDVSKLDESRQATASGSLRERMEVHRRDPQCAVCHRQMDALGFALENFDPIGRWRDRDGKFDIDASGRLPGSQAFDGPAELKTLLKEERGEQFARCLSEKMLTYAMGRGLESYDRGTVRAIAGALAKREYKFSALIEAIIHSDPFQKRRTGGSSP